MKLKATNYVSSNGSIFSEMFIEEESVKYISSNNYLVVNFEMYSILNGEKNVYCERSIAFHGMTGDEISSNRTAIISIPNPDYAGLLAAIPETVQIASEPEFIEDVLNPDYPGDLITIPNPDYDNLVSSIQEYASIPLLQYLYEHAGEMPEEYEFVDRGYPNFEDSLTYFSGVLGGRITITNPIAKGWLLNTLDMDNQKITQFQFVD